ncbi:hypothetical protein NDU88_003253 [Pleurodeles waltl]|uniref:Uncharacterized protein n=1 Tax=Pleurodeles waltl TaxID=8319 RepID=A0AAV7T576_PLEWA|nr:hypothetical protein NDU88_003253 [Pleurodeles waltl]
MLYLRVLEILKVLEKRIWFFWFFRTFLRTFEVFEVNEVCGQLPANYWPSLSLGKAQGRSVKNVQRPDASWKAGATGDDLPWEQAAPTYWCPLLLLQQSLLPPLASLTTLCCHRTAEPLCPYAGEEPTVTSPLGH